MRTSRLPGRQLLASLQNRMKSRTSPLPGAKFGQATPKWGSAVWGPLVNGGVMQNSRTVVGCAMSEMSTTTT